MHELSHSFLAPTGCLDFFLASAGRGMILPSFLLFSLLPCLSMCYFSHFSRSCLNCPPRLRVRTYSLFFVLFVSLSP
ncbi:hypothetical protein BO79DRAFT_3155 [Aspergillus costaricaensis CBS 115574]|uniref:Uncharacterized protein n=1 Tax=Aspergillus costaricaensis CBS 115574 TaxID=1448317 RepID=A0ACD1IWE0_9EURO|nr:hypothetical protein BO79DRAFT_3155 [Aspergillus costaricaensis CBS 115574]RAK94453.1 hypothetical protein BO79DRAFT_3155 [Aspergillus costaricaensis CBS 115574]